MEVYRLPLAAVEVQVRRLELQEKKSNQVQNIKRDELAWQQEKENVANRQETAMFNRAQQWVLNRIRVNLSRHILSKKFNIWDVVGQQYEYDERVKQQENKAPTDNFARSDIHARMLNYSNGIWCRIAQKNYQYGIRFIRN